MLGGPFEEIMSGFFDQPLETLSGLTALPVLAHDVGDEVFLNVNPLAGCDSVGCFGTIDNEQSVGFFVDEHFLELR